MTSVRRILGALVAIVAIPLLGLSAAAFFGHADWRLDLVANARVQLWWLGGLLLLAALPTRSRAAITAAALAAAVNLAVVAPLYVPRGGEAEADITILSFNLLSNNEGYEEIVAYIRDSGADVVFLHEGTARWEDALAGFYLPGYEVVSGRTDELIFGTIALVPTGSEVTNLGFGSRQGRALEVSVDGYSILGVHPLAPVSEREAALRDAQHAAYAAWADGRDRAIVVGDFNATPWTAPFRDLRRAGLMNSQRGFGVSPTWEVGQIWALPIDHLVHSPDLVTIDRVVGPDLGSDHRPLLVRLGPLSASSASR